MVIMDTIYGEFEIGDTVIIELLKSPSLLRLKNISQYGVPDKYYHQKNFSRYEHSVGVMLLLRRLGASLEEQIAGLLHDVSHLAFSHVADWVFAEGNKGNEDLQNNLMEEFIRNDKITNILTKNRFSIDRLLNEKNYPLLESKIPDLCADRVDYALREFKYWLKPKIVNRCLGGLKNYNGEIVFTDKRIAFLFASNFLKLQIKHWGGFETVVRYHLFSEVLKLTLQEKIIKKRDFYKDDFFILTKLEGCRSQKVKEILNLLGRKDLKNCWCKFGKKVFKKFRYVDPKVTINKDLIRLSSLNGDFAKLLKKYEESNKKGLII